jgi:hypothetical protein
MEAFCARIFYPGVMGLLICIELGGIIMLA